MHLATTWEHQLLHPAIPTLPSWARLARALGELDTSRPPLTPLQRGTTPRTAMHPVPPSSAHDGGPETYKGALSVVDARGKRQFHSLSENSSRGIGSGEGGGVCSLFPYTALHGLELVGCHSMARGEVACEILFLSSARPSFSARRRRRKGSVPAVILASISTLESAGIHDSGSSTRSWIGMLFSMVCC